MYLIIINHGHKSGKGHELESVAETVATDIQTMKAELLKTQERNEKLVGLIKFLAQKLDDSMVLSLMSEIEI